MQKRFLINADGTIPANAPLDALAAAGVILVVPTARPVPGEGQMLVELDAVQDGAGVWRQVWALADAPEPEVVMPDLTRQQWVFLQNHPQIKPLFAAVEVTLESASPLDYALVQAHKASDVARWARTLQLIETFAPFLPDGVRLDAETLLPMWMQAAAADI